MVTCYTLQKATGITFDVDVDWSVWVAPAQSKGKEDKAGEVLYTRYVDSNLLFSLRST